MKTENYQLNQWEATDKLSREDFNADNAAIDAAIKAVETAVGSKADASAVAALTTALGSKGNCRIATGSYTGNGTYGASNAITLNFGFKPLMVAVGCDYCSLSDTDPSVLLRGQTKAPSNWGASSGESSLMQLTWTDTSVSWYNAKYEGYQNNEADQVYYWVALGV